MVKYLILLTGLVWLIASAGRQAQIPDLTVGQEGERYLYIGAEACASTCHNSVKLGHQYDLWKASGHSRGYASLLSDKARVYALAAGIEGKPAESRVCLGCHVTAATCDTASLGPTYRKEDGITCEACHKAEFNPKTSIPGEADCLRCHTGSVHEVEAFDFAEGCRRISHPRPETQQAGDSAAGSVKSFP